MYDVTVTVYVTGCFLWIIEILIKDKITPTVFWNAPSTVDVIYALFHTISKEIRQAFDQEVTTGGKRYIFSAAVSGGPAVMAIYNVSEMAK